MLSNTLMRRLSAAMIIGLMAWVGPVHAQEPSAAAVAAAKELIVLRGGARIYESVIPGIIEQSKLLLLQTNPLYTKELNEVAAKLRVDYAPKTAALVNDIARIYATRFTEQELKDLLAFHKTPLGKKLMAEEPNIFDQSMTYTQSWASKLQEEILNQTRVEMKKRGHDM
jgi:hypothetical protein